MRPQRRGASAFGGLGQKIIGRWLLITSDQDKRFFRLSETGKSIVRCLFPIGKNYHIKKIRGLSNALKFAAALF